MSRLQRGWTLLWQSFSVLRSNKNFFIFSFLSGFITFFLITISLIPLHHYEKVLFPLSKIKFEHILWIYLFVLVFLFISHVVIYFFSGAIIACTLNYFERKPAYLTTGFKVAFSKFLNIYLWISYASTIGIFIYLFQGFLKKFKSMDDLLIESNWNIATYLVLPILIAEKKSALKSFRRSADLMYTTWGLSVKPNFGYGIYIFLARIFSLIPLIIALIFYPNNIGIIVGIFITAFLFLLITAFTMSINAVLKSAIYIYASQKIIPPHFNEELKYAFIYFKDY